MNSVKAFLASLGTASGVAWPALGLTSAAFSITTGGLWASIFGLGSSGVFLFVSIPTLFISYNSFKNNDKKLNEKLHKSFFFFRDSFISKLIDLQESVANHPLEQNDLLLELKNAFREEPSHEKFSKDFIHLFLIKLASNKSKWVQILAADPKEKKSLLHQPLNEYIATLTNSEYYKNKIHHSEALNNGFLAFAGCFGSIAGFACGFGGFLTGIGVFAGFAACPWLAAIILGVAVVCAIFFTKNIMRITEDYERKHRLYKDLKHAGHYCNSLMPKPCPLNSEELNTTPKPCFRDQLFKSTKETTSPHSRGSPNMKLS